MIDWCFGASFVALKSDVCECLKWCLEG